MQTPHALPQITLLITDRNDYLCLDAGRARCLWRM